MMRVKGQIAKSYNVTVNDDPKVIAASTFSMARVNTESASVAFNRHFDDSHHSLQVRSQRRPDADTRSQFVSRLDSHTCLRFRYHLRFHFARRRRINTFFSRSTIQRIVFVSKFQFHFHLFSFPFLNRFFVSFFVLLCSFFFVQSVSCFSFACYVLHTIFTFSFFLFFFSFFFVLSCSVGRSVGRW